MRRGIRMGPADRRAEPSSFDAAALIPRVLQERAIFPLYQPIMDLASRAVVGAEALARGPAGSPVESPEKLLAAASRAGLMPLVDQLCFTRAIEIALDARDVAPPLLFVNAEPAVLDQPITPELLAAVRSERPFRIVMEYTERELAAHPAALLSLAGHAHQDGNALALDDVGTNPLSLAFLPLLEPEVVKLDAHLLRDPRAHGTVETATVVNGYAERTGAIVLAEGIETEDDLVTAHSLGARWGQGWLFGPPGPLTAIAGWPVRRDVQLGAPNPDMYRPSGTPFTVMAMRHPIRAGDQRTVDGLTEHLLSVAESNGSHAVVLGGYPDQGVGRAWLARLAPVAETAAYVGIVGPSLAGAGSDRVRVTEDPADRRGLTEAALAVVGPHATAALCLRSGFPGGTVEYILTHDPSVVRMVARMLMGRLDTPHMR